MRTILLLLFLAPIALMAQKKEKGLGWKLISSVGVTAGESASTPAFQLSGGATFDQYFAGVGIGYDKYANSSLPVFADGRISFTKKQLVFAYLQLGYNFRVGKYDEDTLMSKQDRLVGGFYGETGLGYRIPLGGFHFLSFSAGYSHKEMKRDKIAEVDYFGEYHYRYSYNRIAFRLSWEFGGK